MAAQKEPLKVFRVEMDGSTYYATGADAFSAFASIVEHDQREGNFAHKADLSFGVDAETVGEATEPFVAWRCA